MHEGLRPEGVLVRTILGKPTNRVMLVKIRLQNCRHFQFFFFVYIFHFTDFPPKNMHFLIIRGGETTLLV